MTTSVQSTPAAAFWSPLRTHRHKEALALRELERQGFDAHCPMVRKTIRRARRLLERKVPLFPGYMFVGFARDSQQWRPINSTPGVQYLLADEHGRPARLPAGFVEDLRNHTDDAGFFSFHGSLAPGDAVRVHAGPFSELLGRIEALDETGRARVLLDLMSRAVRVSLPAADLRAVA